MTSREGTSSAWRLCVHLTIGVGRHARGRTITRSLRFYILMGQQRRVCWVVAPRDKQTRLPSVKNFSNTIGKPNTLCNCLLMNHLVRLRSRGEDVLQERPGVAVEVIPVIDLGCCLGHKARGPSGRDHPAPGCIVGEGLPGTAFTWGLATGYETCREYDALI